MAGTEQLRREIGAERERLAEAVDELRTEIGRTTNIGAKLGKKKAVGAASAFGLGFVASGGIGATMRLIFRRGREAEEQASVGRFRLLRRR